jgi:HEAT repeat protein
VAANTGGPASGAAAGALRRATSTLDEWVTDLISGDELRAEEASEQLAAQGQTSLPHLSGLLGSSVADQRWWALRTLARMTPVDTQAFVRALRDDSAEVRQAAALALVAHPRPSAADALIRTLRDPDALVQTLAADALLAIGKEVVPQLLEALPGAQGSARIQMMRLLAELRDARAIPAMLKCMDEDSAMVYHWAEIGLQNLGLDMVYLKMS